MPLARVSEKRRGVILLYKTCHNSLVSAEDECTQHTRLLLRNVSAEIGNLLLNTQKTPLQINIYMSLHKCSQNTSMQNWTQRGIRLLYANNVHYDKAAQLF